MNFNETIKKRLTSLLQNEGYRVSEEYHNVVQFESLIMKLRICYDCREKLGYLYIGRLEDILYPLDDQIVMKLIGHKLLINSVSIDIFIGNLITLFQEQNMIKLLQGDISILEKIVKQDSREYTLKLFREQILKNASCAWERKDYNTYIECINKLNIQEIPNLYLQRYKIAKRNI